MPEIASTLVAVEAYLHRRYTFDENTGEAWMSQPLPAQLADLYPGWEILGTVRDLNLLGFVLRSDTEWLASWMLVSPAAIKDPDQAWGSLDDPERDAALTMSILSARAYADNLADLVTHLVTHLVDDFNDGNESIRLAAWITGQPWCTTEVKTLIAMGGCGGLGDHWLYRRRALPTSHAV